MNTYNFPNRPLISDDMYAFCINNNLINSSSITPFIKKMIYVNVSYNLEFKFENNETNIIDNIISFEIKCENSGSYGAYDEYVNIYTKNNVYRYDDLTNKWYNNINNMRNGFDIYCIKQENLHTK
uniref:Uncharacterized protein n=1 Tax=viral metagenome TaxID=1070528 RepID=A0A6C0HXX5_9ZZZZ